MSITQRQSKMLKIKTPGRKRSLDSEEAVLAATAEMLKVMPLRDIAIEEIAKRAGVGKTTIYKWWPAKAYVALDAFLKVMQKSVTVPDTGCAKRDITEQLKSVIRFYTGSTGAIVKQFFAEGQSDPEFRQAFLKRFLRSRREATRVMWERGWERGELDPNIDIDVAMDIVYGPLIFRMLTGHAPLNDREAEAIVDAALSGIWAKVPSAKRKIK
jgi:AcrR family transcriptional regulator